MTTRMKNALVLLLFTALASCSKDESSCPETIFLGEFSPTEFALDALPYKQNTTVIFTDSLSNRLEFTVSEPPFQMMQWVIPGPCPVNYYQQVNFEHFGGTKMFLLENDSAALLLQVMVLSVQEYESRKIYDDLVVTIGVTEPGGGAYYQTLTLPVDQRTLRDPEFERIRTHIFFDDSASFLGKTFQGVYHEMGLTDADNFKTYYTFEEGVVSFRDQEGRRWVFEEVME